jgi:hypothetical protein
MKNSKLYFLILMLGLWTPLLQAQNLTILEKKGKWGIIDKKKKVMVPFEFKQIEETPEGLFRLTSLDDKFGLANKQGKIVVAPQYDNLNPYYLGNGLIPVALQDKWGYINLEGKEVIPCKYDAVYQFGRGGIACVEWNGKKGLIDTKNQIVTPFEYDYLNYETIYLASAQDSKYISASQNEKYGMLDIQGRVVIPCVYDSYMYEYTSSTEQPIFITQLKGKYGAIDKNENVLIPFEYDELTYGNGYYQMKKGQLWGWQNVSTQKAIAPTYQSIDLLTKNVYMVQENNQYGLVDTHTGNKITAIEYQSMGYLFYQSELGDYINYAYEDYGLIPAQLNGKWGLVNMEGKVIVPFELDKVYEFEKDNRAKIVKGNQTGYLDKTGKVYFEK